MIPLNTPLNKASIWKHKGMVDFHDEKTSFPPPGAPLDFELPQSFASEKRKTWRQNWATGETGDGRNPANHLLRER